MKLSQGADVIKSILSKEKVPFQLEYIIKTGGKEKVSRYRFDFAILGGRDNLPICLIEYDSELHFKQITKFHKTRQDFLAAQERDRQKNLYCLASSLPLYRIPFWEVNNLSSCKDILSPPFLVKGMYHNDLINPFPSKR